MHTNLKHKLVISPRDIHRNSQTITAGVNFWPVLATNHSINVHSLNQKVSDTLKRKLLLCVCV